MEGRREVLSLVDPGAHRAIGIGESPVQRGHDGSDNAIRPAEERTRAADDRVSGGGADACPRAAGSRTGRGPSNAAASACSGDSQSQPVFARSRASSVSNPVVI